jgi:hypothetical protein
MSKALKIADIDPTLPRIELKLGTKSYFLVFTFKALAAAQKGLRDIGVEVNLLHALDLSNVDAEKLVPLLFAAMITHQPTISPLEVVELVTFKNLGTIFEKIAEAYGASLAEPDKGDKEDKKENPTEAV